MSMIASSFHQLCEHSIMDSECWGIRFPDLAKGTSEGLMLWKIARPF